MTDSISVLSRKLLIRWTAINRSHECESWFPDEHKYIQDDKNARNIVHTDRNYKLMSTEMRKTKCNQYVSTQSR